jgi:hypothetical protein
MSAAYPFRLNSVSVKWGEAQIARMLYERFYEIARKNGRTFVTSYPALVNIKSMQWHKHMGFSAKEDGDRYYIKKEI